MKRSAVKPSEYGSAVKKFTKKARSSTRYFIREI
jgi:hypothetical protein